MTKNNAFWIRLCLAGSALMLIATIARAQSATPAVLTFDALPRAHKSEAPAPTPTPTATTTRAPRAPSGAIHREVVANLRDQIATQNDSIARLNLALADAILLQASQVEIPRVGVVTVAPLRPSAQTLLSTPKTSPATTSEVRAPKPTPGAATPSTTAAPSFNPTSVSGLLQIMMSGGDSALRSTYRVRRAEVKVVSDLGRRAQAIVMVDAAKALALSTTGTATSVAQSSRILQDAFLSLPFKVAQIDAGQQRLPLGYEGSMSASGLETVDRALMESDKGRGASFGDVRDLGVAVKGKWQWLEYRAGVFNGSGETMNDVDKNVGKAVAGQLALRPAFAKWLRVGGSAVTSGTGALDKPTRDRVGVEMVYGRDRALVQAEAMRGQDGTITRNGMYALGAFSVLRSLKLTTRFDAWDPDVRAESSPADVTERDYLAGLTWLPPATRLKVQFAVVRKTYSHDITPPATLALTQLQASW